MRFLTHHFSSEPCGILHGALWPLNMATPVTVLLVPVGESTHIND